jgi:CRISPR-associated endonuclease/helicase Cas3
MMVLFISQSMKKAQLVVRRILDQYANRVGSDVWRTVITAEGLETVKVLLKKNASKNTAVACHWIRSRNRDDLLWIVGHRDAFDENGQVPVGSTTRELMHREWENDWMYLPFVSLLTALAALFHDWGKASDYFQKKLAEGDLTADPFRHEWISCKILEAVIRCSSAWDDDRKWLLYLSEGHFNLEDMRKALLSEDNHQGKLASLPPLACLLVWLILSHHRLPDLDSEERNRYDGRQRMTVEDILQTVNSTWGYENTKPEAMSRRKECFTFSSGLLWDDGLLWRKAVRKWCARGLEDYDDLKSLMTGEQVHPALRRCLQDARLGLMLGDHYLSSLPASSDQSRWGARSLQANTDRKTGKPKQFLEEHLVGVMKQSLAIVHRLPAFASRMEKAYDVHSLRKTSPPLFRWQDRTAAKIRKYREDREENHAFFIVNMASTGCGKTMANAKIMEAVSEDGESLRYVLALGLRSLTLQTGDEYRERIGLSKDDMAVIIGSSAVLKLHNRTKGQDDTSLYGEDGPFMEQELSCIDTQSDQENQFLDIFFNPAQPESAGKNRNFLYKPVLVTTIDHMMGAVETKRGGRYILPSLRLMSSDLVIDEIDDFDRKDLTAIARLVHLAGMYGRNVAISSATIPPDLAEGMYRSYMAGLACRNAFFSEKKAGTVVWCDEFRTDVQTMDTEDSRFAENHDRFIKARIEKLKKEPAKRRGFLFPCKVNDDESDLIKEYFSSIKQAVLQLHRDHHVVDRKTGKNISIGVIRMANVNPCVELSLYLMQCNWPDHTAVRVMTYHSRQILLLRHEQEKYLDSVLKRKQENGQVVDIEDPVMRNHIDHETEEDIIFILVATPVEETGRDHDFDWAVIEPSSGRSIIQLAGRVLRHRKSAGNISHENVAVMDYNLRGLQGQERAFIWPGYEDGRYVLETHCMEELIDGKRLEEKIDAVPRIRKASHLEPCRRLIDLEQQIMADFNSFTDTGPQCINGWNYEAWWMTALPQEMNRFRRADIPEEKLYAKYIDGKVCLCELDADTSCSKAYGIEPYTGMTPGMKKRLWLSDEERNYIKLLESLAAGQDGPKEKLMKRYSEIFGEITVPASKNNAKTLLYSDQLGLFHMEKEESEIGKAQ